VSGGERFTDRERVGMAERIGEIRAQVAHDQRRTPSPERVVLVCRECGTVVEMSKRDDEIGRAAFTVLTRHCVGVHGRQATRDERTPVPTAGDALEAT